MVNVQLFHTQRGQRVPPADSVNEASGMAYRLPPKAQLAQYALTGCLNRTFYADAETQLDAVLALCGEADAEYLAKTAVYARQRGYMKDLPALLVAYLTVKEPLLAKRVFDRVIDNGRMLRNFVQILRSGAVGRKSLGTAPKRLVQQWLERVSSETLLNASVGQQPSLADLIKMVHPRPQDEAREALYGWLIGRDVAFEKLPGIVQHYERFKRALDQADGQCADAELPPVEFRLLTGLPLTREHWVKIARNSSWQMARMNLNTFVRHGVFAATSEGEPMTGLVAQRLADAAGIRKARAFPYQLMAAYLNADAEVPTVIREALQDALEVSLDNVPTLEGKVYMLVDVSGSMAAPISGYRRGASSKVRCVEVAGLVASALLRRNPTAEVLAFDNALYHPDLNPRDTVLTNTGKLAALGGGGTDCSLPLKALNEREAKGDCVVYVSDNQSWLDVQPRFQGTGTMAAWETFRQRNPAARLVCIDLQPYGTVQAAEREDILNVGGFSDAVFDLLAAFADGSLADGHWVAEIEAVVL